MKLVFGYAFLNIDWHRPDYQIHTYLVNYPIPRLRMMRLVQLSQH